MFRNQQKVRLSSHGSMGACKQLVREAQAFIRQYPPQYRERSDSYRCCRGESNPEQFEYLSKAGFFEFHQTNTGQIVYEHQVEMFLFGSGYKHYRNGYYARKGEVDIHHLDNDRANNDPRNLRYVSPALNLLCAQAIRQLYSGDLLAQSMPESPEEAVCMVKLTLKRFLKRQGIVSPELPDTEWLLSLPHDLAMKILTSLSLPDEVGRVLEPLATY